MGVPGQCRGGWLQSLQYPCVMWGVKFVLWRQGWDYHYLGLYKLIHRFTLFITLFTFYVSFPPQSVVPYLILCASDQYICAGGFVFVPGILAPDVARAAFMVRADSIDTSPTIPNIYPFLGIACAWPWSGVGFGGGRGYLTCCYSQIILKGDDFIAEHAILFLHRCYSVGEGGLVGNNITHVVGK